ncbi:tRNA wybutosine-synthesizing protein 2 homolog isoform X2 [Ornithorhynchus anatinus]|uniref:tRNA wybutosine-synthesizing protein 2 homolog isoform X2 n=1 Tax=Ornithorhynchus anatinus TaxID=9258 RepID=UPI0010A93EF6|nr:tRNA wybutosine-synthesizing protein 2 homolog isoform X2 [Ornithorhynchus anatinus]
MAAALLGASEKGTLKDGKATEVSAVVTETRFTQLYREYLEKQQLLDKRHRVKKLPGGTVALPVVEETFIEQHLQELKMHVAPESTCVLARIQNPLLSKRAQLRSPAQKLRSAVRCLVEGRGVPWSAGLERDLPRAWQRHGDLLLVSEDSFRAPLWEELGQELWETVAAALGVRRLAKRGRVAPGGTRTPRVTLLLGDDGWVEHVDDGIRYTFDVTQCMFCPGNVTEKLRVASLPCAGEVLVDLYAGDASFHRYRRRAVNAYYVPTPWDRLLHPTVPGSRRRGLRPRLRVEPARRGRSEEEPGAERGGRPVPDPRRGQQEAGPGGPGRQGEPGTDPQLPGGLARRLPGAAAGPWGRPAHPPQCGGVSGPGPPGEGAPAATSGIPFRGRGAPLRRGLRERDPGDGGPEGGMAEVGRIRRSPDWDPAGATAREALEDPDPAH